MTDQASQTPKKAEIDPEPSSQILINCPVTGEQTRKLTKKLVDLSNGQASWWHCSACGSWHINLDHKRNRFQELNK